MQLIMQLAINHLFNLMDTIKFNVIIKEDAVANLSHVREVFDSICIVCETDAIGRGHR